MNKIFFELSIYGLNMLVLKGIVLVPVTIAYTNKSYNGVIDPAPTRFLVYYEYLASEGTVLLDELNKYLIALGTQHYKK